ncbi:PhnD/SsuA/transferrin family substrate-binding protein [Megasphaera paucivorans]|uniref:Phosphonate transport system substrate-binding protein n=1 Tax=Megasphaera paucivorans TaxID=349095 RepID=A0A1G9WAU4_9FIRM|nr:PhnD/SsuA/transferrin family substrate-binding protein [Megasphaera paucivorans]SDM81632.1 phosphonate transport system substrate-binding protein [Megasphaera paucivorans]
MKTIRILAAALFMGSLLLTGCSSTPSGGDGKNIAELKIAISPYQDADTMKTHTAPLGKMIQSKMKEKGYNIKKVTLSVGTSYNAVGEALSAGSADMGFISGATYVLYDKDISVLLTALRNGIDKDTTDLQKWNDGTPEKFTDDLTQYYRSCIMVGPSPKGQALLQKVKSGQKPTWQELNDLTWSVMSPASASGYMYPSLWLKEQYGKKISDLSHVVQADSYTTSLARLASGQVDVLVAYSHIRANMAKNWQTKLGGTQDIWEQTGMIAITDKIFNDTVSVSNNSKIMQDEGFRKALGESLIEIGKTKEGIEVLKTIGHKGYDWADRANYDGERQVQQLLK